jgi:hypothetical protein
MEGNANVKFGNTQATRQNRMSERDEKGSGFEEKTQGKQIVMKRKWKKRLEAHEGILLKKYI